MKKIKEPKRTAKDTAESYMRKLQKKGLTIGSNDRNK